MAFPADVMTADEHIVLHVRPHWMVMFRPIFVFVVALAVVIGSFFWPDNEFLTYILGGLALIAVVWLAVWPWLVWRCTHYVLTNERIIFQTGVFSRDRRDIPLMRVNDHTMNQTFFERVLGSGTLTIESAGERGQTVLKLIPDVERVQTTLYELVEGDRDKHTLEDAERHRHSKDPDATK